MHQPIRRDSSSRRQGVATMDTASAISVVHSFPTWLPQTQTWLYTQVAEQQRLGVSAFVVCEETENLDQFGVANIRALSNAGALTRLWDKGLRKLGIRQHLEFLVRVCREVGADVVHSHFGNVAWSNLGGVRRAGAKHVVTFYGLDVSLLPTRFPVWRTRYRELFAEADLILCEGPYMAGRLVDLGCPRGKVKVQHLGVDLEAIPCRPRRLEAGRDLRVLIAASFREKKGIPVAVDALGLLSRDVSLQLTIIGDAGADDESRAEKRRILEALDRNGLRERTRLLGYRTHSEMLREAYAHDVFLQPSVTAASGDTEGGAPVSIIEMLASGMPVIGTTHCDIPEVVGPALQRFLAPERDAAALADCLWGFLDQSSDWPSLASDARRRLEQEYDAGRQAERLVLHYCQLAGKP